MKPPVSGTIAAAVVLAGLAVSAIKPVGPLPALGAFFDPVNGIVRSVRSAELPDSAHAAIPGLAGETRVVYDDRAVPHIFATTIVDAYRALGYVVARDRLFQIETQARAAAGTLTELVGFRAWPLDKAAHEAGMPDAAARRLAKYDTTSAGWSLIRAYADGVNAFVDGLEPGDYPFEYKLLGSRPKRWEPIDMLHLLNRMGLTLASTDDALDHLEASARIGRAAADALFPVHAPIVEPIQPNGAPSPRVDAVRIPDPGPGDSAARAVSQALRSLQSTQLLSATTARSDDAVGSNNWAVSPSRSASGHALLAGDPHLELTLPSIWYEVHLVVPDSLDVYGVTIPGAPGVVIGFNRAVAWTFTNTGADVMDYYVEQVNDSVRPTSYVVDGERRPISTRTHIVRDNTGDELAERHVFMSTHRGPLQKIGGQWVSVRWTVLETSRDFEAFDAAARATNARELLDAMASSYGAPAQNMLVADTAGNIAIRSTGRYPVRPGTGRGDVFQDGTSSANDWTGYWPVADYPQSFNPAQGFLASANQEPLDPRVQPRYLGSNWERPWRAMRINQLLRADSAVTPDAMRRYQSDPGSARAEWFVPAFLNAARNVTVTQRLARASALLGEWDRTYTASSNRTLLFEYAMSELARRLWDELRPDSSSRAPLPTDMMTAVLLRDSASIWWDDRRTPTVETRDELLAQVLETALDRMLTERGEPDSKAWEWGSYRFANINHLLGLPALSRRRIPVQGGPATLWPSSGSGSHGPSWRMVVELSDIPRAWGTYPGGQSGNPLSRRYDDRIEQWSRGELDSLRVPRTAADLDARHVMSTLRLSPATAGGNR